MSGLKSSILIKLSHPSEVGGARREAVRLASSLSFDETESGRVAIVVTELANNVVNHGRGGILILRQLCIENTFGLEILAIDRGPGMGNVSECMRDGYSSAGSPGTGMGAILRLSGYFDLFSRPDGTVVVSQLWSKVYATKLLSKGARLDTGAICLPNAGETQCGDDWGVSYDSGRILLMVADGLGHGPKAAEASNESVRVLEACAKETPIQIMKTAHQALRKTRGAAVALTVLHADHRNVSYVAVGNIVSAVISSESEVRRMASQNGTIGLQSPTLQEQSYEWSDDSTFVMHSDGLISHWKLDNYPGLMRKHPSIIAAIFYRDFKRGTDDVTVLVAKKREPAHAP
jgi:anti-sigma regulatory factor (Ser/Thr protein kinase)